ncbi:retrovirus-related pol polyprotein from transposon TNT 1-94 [Tanacetum coccineum]
MRYVDTKTNKNELRHCIEKGPYILTELVTEAVLVVGDELGESINKQDVKTKLFWEFGKFTSRYGESVESYYSRFYKMMNEMVRNKLKVDTMQQHQNEVNINRAKKITRNANPLALVVATQHYPDTYSPDTYYQAPKPHKTHTSSSRHTTSTSSHATTKNKGKKIAKPITPPSESASEEDSDPEHAKKDKDMQKNLALIAKYIKNIYKPTNNLITSSNARNKKVDTSPRFGNDRNTGQFGNQRTVTIDEARETIGNQVVQKTKLQCFNCKEYGHFSKEYRKLKRAKDYEYHKEKMINVTPDSSDMCDNEGTADQNDEESEDKCVLLASLIANLKLDVDENKKSQKQLKKANTSLTQELEKSKQDLKISKQDFSYCKSEFEKYKMFQTNHKDKEKAELKCEKTLGLLEETKRLHNESSKTQSYTTFCVKEANTKLVNHISTHESKISQILKENEQMKKDFKERENKDIDKLITLENQIKFLTNVVYKTGQPVQTMHMLTPKPSSYYTGLGVSSFANPLYLKKVQLEKPCLYNVKYDKNDLSNLFAPNSDETIRLAEESRSNLCKAKVKPYDYTKQNSLYELFTPQTEKSHE